MKHFVVLLICCLAFAADRSWASTMVPSLSPVFLRYESTVEVVFTLSDQCTLDQKLVLYHIDKQNDPQYWQDLDATKPWYYTRPNASAIKIPSTDYTAVGTYIGRCGLNLPYDDARLRIPVAPKVLNARVKDAGDRSTLKSFTQSSDGYYSYYEYSTYFDNEASLATLQLDVGDGKSSDEKTVGQMTLKGDKDLISMPALSSTVLLKDPNFPNGTVSIYRMNATKWSLMPEAKCSANVTARSAISGTGNADLWHEAVIVFNLNYRPQVLKVSATSKSSTCEIACEVNSACPYTDVTLKLEIFDEANNTLGSATVDKSSKIYRVAVSDIDSVTCEKLVALAQKKPTESGLARCTVQNSVGAKIQYWPLTDVSDLSGLYVGMIWEWWMILAIALAGVFLLIIIIGIIIILCIRHRRGKAEKEEESEMKHVTYQTGPNAPPPSNLRPPMQSNSYAPQPAYQQQQQSLQTEFIRQQDQPLQQNYYGQQQIYQGPVSQTGSSYFGGNPNGYSGDLDTGYPPTAFQQPQPVQPLASEYRTVTVANTPRSRQPIVAGEGDGVFYDNPAFSRTPATQRSIRHEVIV